MIPMVGITELMGIGLLTLPGTVFALRMKPVSIREWITLTLLFSILITGNVLYAGSYLVGLSPAFISIFFLASLALVLWKRKEIENGIQTIPRSTKKVEKLNPMIVVGVLVIVGLAGLLTYAHPDLEYDSLAYHLPFIQDFSQNGQDHFYPTPQNNYEIRSNLYPKFMESLVGGIQTVAPSVARGIPWLIFVLALLLIYELTRRIQPGRGPLLAVAFFASSILVILQSFSFYVDLLATLWIVGIAFLIVRERAPTLKHFFLMGALIGALMATKATSILFLPAIAIVLFLYFKPTKRNQLIGLGAGILLGGAYYVFVLVARYLASPVSLFHFGAGNVDLIEGDLLAHLFQNTQGFAFILILFALLGYFCWLVFPTYVYSLFRIRSKEEKIVQLLGGLILLTFFLFTIVTTGNVRSDTFPRFILPWFALACVMGGIALTRWTQAIPYPHMQKIIGKLMIGIVVAGLIVTSYWAYNHHTLLDQVETENIGTWAGLQKSIANDPSTRLYYANTPNGIYYGFEQAEIFDYSSFQEPTTPACDFLKSKKINRIVVFNFTEPRPEYGAFNTALMKETQNGTCGTLLSKTTYWMAIYSLP